MSFPRARTKRFNEEIGCAPGVGHYNPKVETKASNVVFDKTSRFADQTDGTVGSESVFVAPRRLIKSGLTRSSGSLQDRLNRSSSSSLGSQECLLPRKRFGSTSKSRSNSERELTSLLKLVDDLETSVKDKDTYIAHLLDVIAKLDEKKASLEEDEEVNREKLESLEKLVMQLIDIKDLKVSLVTTKGQSIEQADKLKADLLELYSQFQNVMTYMKVSRNKVKDLETSLDVETESKKSVEVELDTVKLDFDKLQKTLEVELKLKDSVTSELETLKKQFQQQNKDLEYLKEQYKLAVLDLQVKDLEIQQFQNEARESEDSQESLLKDLESIASKFESAQIEIQTTHEAVENLREQLRALEEQNVQLERDSQNSQESLRKDLGSIWTKFESAQLEIQTTHEANKNLREQLGALEKQNFQLERDSENTRESLVKDIISITTKFKSAQLEIQTSHKEIENLQEQLRALEEKNVHLETQHKADLDATYSLGCQLENNRLEVESVKKELETNLETYTKNMEGEAIRYREMQQKFDALNADYTAMKDRMESNAADLESMRRELETSSGTYTKNMNEQTLRYKELQRKLDALNADYASLRGGMECKAAELERSKSKLVCLEKQYSLVNGELSLKNKDFDQLHKQWNQLTTVISVLDSEKKALEDNFQILKADVTFKEESLKSLLDDLKLKDEVIAVMETKRIESEITINDLKYQLAFVQNEFQNFEMEKQDLLGGLAEKESVITELENLGLAVESTVSILRNDLEQKEEALQNLETKWLQCNSTLKDTLEEIKSKDNRISNLECSLVRCQESLQQSLTEVANLSRQLSSTEERLSHVTTTTQLRNMELGTKDEQLEAAMESIRDAERKHQAQRDEIQDLAEDLQTKAHDAEKWKKLYETLEAKTAPFKDQIDAYSMERELLVHEKDRTFKELSDLADKYAKSMGHQNHKQKIQYVVKLKEEIMELKKENSRLRAINTPKKDFGKKAFPSSAKKPLRSKENNPAYF